jgi:hypothetical protein
MFVKIILRGIWVCQERRRRLTLSVLCRKKTSIKLEAKIIYKVPNNTSILRAHLPTVKVLPRALQDIVLSPPVNFVYMNLFGKKYECQLCGTTFKYESELSGHGQIHTPQTQDHSGHEHFTCGACAASFHSKTELGKHGQKYHM